jgi:hypothetical protein
MPPLVVLAATPWYAPFRLVLSAAGLVFATSWALERATLTGSDPFLVTEWLVAHPFMVAVALGVLALAARAGETSATPRQPRRLASRAPASGVAAQLASSLSASSEREPGSAV